MYMEKLRNELIELIQLGYEYEAQMNIGNGWEPYEGCQQNLVMILEGPDTEVYVVENGDQFYSSDTRRYNITLPSWWTRNAGLKQSYRFHNFRIQLDSLDDMFLRRPR